MTNEILTDSANNSSVKTRLAASSAADGVNHNEINIKHRLTGAAILIALGVIILPLLLGSYSSVDEESSSNSELLAVNVEEQNSAFDNIEEGDIKVFVSKIRPRGENGEATTSKPEPLMKMKAKATPAVKEAIESSDEALKDKLAASMNKPLIKRKEVSELASKIKDKTKDVTAIQTQRVAAVAQPLKVFKSKPKPGSQIQADTAVKKQAPTKAKVVAKQTAKTVTEGYIVSVGVYLQTSNAENVYKKLNDKGFKPSKGLFETSKGKATRVWLGPFATRADAGRKKTRLQNVMGERGLIKRYP